jgi:hypothetical protein
MAVNLLTPFTQVLRRSVPVASGVSPITGRWVSTDASGAAILPTAAGQGNVSLVVEGIQQPSVDATFDASNVPSLLISLPSSVASGQVALAYGIFRYSVGPEGFTAAVASANPGQLLYVTTAGILDTTAGAGKAVAVVEYASATLLTVRTLAVA